MERGVRFAPLSEAAASVQRLLVAYGDLLDDLNARPVRLLVRKGPRGAEVRLTPIGAWMLRFLTAWHFDRALGNIETALRLRSARGVSGTGEDAILKRVEHLRKSLPSRSGILRVTAVVTHVVPWAAAIASAIYVAFKVPASGRAAHTSKSAASNKPAASWSSRVAQDIANWVYDTALFVTKVIAHGHGHVTKPTTAGNILATVILLLAAALIASMFAWPLTRAFRFKRALFNLYPNPSLKVVRRPFLWSATRSGGIYELEREVRKPLHAEIPAEPPFDLFSSAPAPACWVVFMGFVLYWVIDGYIELIHEVNAYYSSPAAATVRAEAVFQCEFFMSIYICACLLLIAPGVMRLMRLMATMRKRNGNSRTAFMLPDALTVAWLNRPLRCRSPLLVGWLSLLPAGLVGLTSLFLAEVNASATELRTTGIVLLVVCMIPLSFTWRLWWSTARDLRDLGGATFAQDVERLQRIKPRTQALAVGPFAFTLVLPFIVLFRAAGYVRCAQEAVRLERPVSRHLAWLAFLWPVQCILLQRELNRLWQSDVVSRLHDPATVPDIRRYQGDGVGNAYQQRIPGPTRVLRDGT